jgi:hypothetical protein
VQSARPDPKQGKLIVTIANTAHGSSYRWSPLADATALSRNEFFFWLFVVGCANGLLGRIIQSIRLDGLAAALLGIDINVIVLFACYAGLSMLYGAVRTEPAERVRRVDFLAGAIFLVITALPIFPLSWLAVTGLTLYILCFAPGGPDRRRAAIILLALTVPMFWSRLLFQFFAKLILDIDATLVASLLGSTRSGNMVQFVDGSGYMVVLAQCSSLANMSLAFLCWVSVTQWARHQWTPMDLLWSGLACLSVITVNVTRISLMGLSRDSYNAIHNDWGDLVANTTMLVLMVAFSMLGARREIFARV